MLQQSATDQLRRVFENLRQLDKVKIFIAFGNPIGNAVGDTAIATQHVSFIRAILPKSQFVIWSSAKAIWEELAGDVHVLLLPTRLDFENSDLIIIDWATVGPDFREFFKSVKAPVLSWQSWGADPTLILNGQVVDKIDLPPNTNIPARIGQLYRLIGSQASLCGLKAGTSQNVVIQPCSGQRWKSIPLNFLVELLSELEARFQGRVSIEVLLPDTQKDDESKEYYLCLSKLCQQHPKSIKILSGYDLRDFSRTISTSCLVIGPDSSGQHIAALSKVPSIALFMPRSGSASYFFGWQSWPSFQFTVRNLNDRATLIRGISFLSSCILGFQETDFDQAELAGMLKLGRNLGRILRNMELDQFPIVGQQFISSASHVLGAMDASIAALICEEVQFLIQELSEWPVNVTFEKRNILIQRSRSLNFVRIARAIGLARRPSIRINSGDVSLKLG